MSSREELLLKTKLYEQLERYNGVELSDDERNLFSLAHKNLIGPKRIAHRVVTHTMRVSESDDPAFTEMATKMKEEIESEMRNLSHQVIGMIDNYLLKTETPAEARVFYLKLYLAEFEVGNDKNDAAEYSLDAYKKAYELACSELQPTHPIRLGVALNFAVFYYEIVNSADRACKLAKQAFDDAIAELDNLSDVNYKDSTLVMQLLRDNLTLWISEMKIGQ